MGQIATKGMTESLFGWWGAGGGLPWQTDVKNKPATYCPTRIEYNYIGTGIIGGSQSYEDNQLLLYDDLIVPTGITLYYTIRLVCRAGANYDIVVRLGDTDIVAEQVIVPTLTNGGTYYVTKNYANNSYPLKVDSVIFDINSNVNSSGSVRVVSSGLIGSGAGAIIGDLYTNSGGTVSSSVSWSPIRTIGVFTYTNIEFIFNFS